jgi:uncharacterized membrane protein (DUF106 family)
MRESLSAYMEPPASTILIVLLSLALAVVSVTVTRLLTDVKRRNEYQREMQEYMRDLREAQKSGDKRLYEKLKRKEDRFRTLQRQSMKDMYKSFVMIIPFYAFWMLFNGVFLNPATGLPRIVAFAPLPIPFLGSQLSFGNWYILCSLGLSTPIMRAAGVMVETGVPPPKSQPSKPEPSGKGR